MLANDTASLKGFLTTLHQRAVLPARGRPALHLLWRQTCFPELQNMLMTAVLDTSASKHGWVVSTETVGRCAVAGSRASSGQPQIQIFRTRLLKVDVLTGLLLDAFLTLTAEATLSSLPSSCQDRLASSELSCPVLSKISRESA